MMRQCMGARRFYGNQTMIGSDVYAASFVPHLQLDMGHPSVSRPVGAGLRDLILCRLLRA